MLLSYDPNTGDILGFYTTEIHGDQIPEPIIEITEAEWQDCLDNPGRRRVNGGKIVHYEPPIDMDFVREQKVEEIRQSWRSEIDEVGMPIPNEDYTVDFDVEDALIWENGLAMSDSDPVEVRAKDNSMHSMPRELAIKIPDLQKAHYAILLQKKWDLQKRVCDAKTLQELEDIKW